AGDELFGGYSTYLWGRSVHQRVSWLPRGLRAAAAKSLGPLSKVDWNGLFDKHRAVVPGSLKKRDLTRVLEKLASVLAVTEREALYRVLLSYWMDPSSVVLGSREKATALTDKDGWADLHDFVHVMMYLDTVTYLPDDILVKVDRASMGVSLESRVPLLDHRIRLAIAAGDEASGQHRQGSFAPIALQVRSQNACRSPEARFCCTRRR